MLQDRGYYYDPSQPSGLLDAWLEEVQRIHDDVSSRMQRTTHPVASKNSKTEQARKETNGSVSSGSQNDPGAVRFAMATNISEAR